MRNERHPRKRNPHSFLVRRITWLEHFPSCGWNGSNLVLSCRRPHFIVHKIKILVFTISLRSIGLIQKSKQKNYFMIIASFNIAQASLALYSLIAIIQGWHTRRPGSVSKPKEIKLAALKQNFFLTAFSTAGYPACVVKAFPRPDVALEWLLDKKTKWPIFNYHIVKFNKSIGLDCL